MPEASHCRGDGSKAHVQKWRSPQRSGAKLNYGTHFVASKHLKDSLRADGE